MVGDRVEVLIAVLVIVVDSTSVVSSEDGVYVTGVTTTKVDEVTIAVVVLSNTLGVGVAVVVGAINTVAVEMRTHPTS